MKKVAIALFIIFAGQNGFSQSLSLNECIDLALKSNPDLQKSEYNVKQSQLSTKQAYSELYPGVSANASTSSSGPIADKLQENWDWNVGGSISQQLYRPGMYSGIGLAKAQQAASQYSNTSLRDHIRTSVEKLYFQILASDTLIGVYNANIQLADEQITKMERMVELGLKRHSDLLKSKVQRGTFQSQLIRELQSLASSKRSLNILMGRHPNTDIAVQPTAVNQILVPDYQTAYAMMLEHSPDIKRLKSQIDVQRLALRISKEAYLPSVSGTYSYSQYNSAFGGSALDNDQINVRLSMDLFDGFYKKQNVQKNQINLDEAKLDYDAALRDQEEALSNQYKALETQNQLIEIHETNLASARQDLDVVSEQYDAGLSTILDLNDARVSVLESETSLLQDLYTRKQIEAEIKRLIGE
ncbi:TolC family protein [candidate division KSB1 bacterium]|nr:TolC family protein [candidate division KSB1 bacterium]